MDLISQQSIEGKDGIINLIFIEIKGSGKNGRV